MKVWVLIAQEFQGPGTIWDVYADVEAAKRDVNLPHDIEWSRNHLSGIWQACSDLTWNSYALEEFEVKEEGSCP